MNGTAIEMVRQFRGTLFIASGVFLLASGSGIDAQTAAALIVEQHPAQVLLGPQVATLNAAKFASNPDDTTPFGVDLNGLMIVDAHANGGRLVRHDAVGGVNTSFGGPTAQNDSLGKLLSKYVGQPLSFRLLSSIQTDITQFFRENGRSLVSVTVPQQEITSGIVQINVTAFVLATTQIEGSDPATTAFLNRQVRLKPGQEVDTDTLLADVNWMNQNPFRHVAVVFEPGSAPSSTNLTLHVQTGKPWSGYLGASNAGTMDTGLIRLFGGFNASYPSWQDQQLSYQFTGSPDSLGKLHLWDAGTAKGYLSHALSYVVPITAQSGFRTKLTFGASHISSYSVPGGVFTSGTETTIFNLEAAFPLPKTSGRLTMVPELYAQFEVDAYARQPFFVGIPLTGENTKLSHAAIGLRTEVSGQFLGKTTRGSADIAFVFGRRNTDGLADSLYSFVKFLLKQEIVFKQDSSLALRVRGQTSNDVLHPLEQLALGGDGTVRGYPVNGVAGSTAIAASIEYRPPTWSFKAGKQDGTFRPHIFADFGFAEQDVPFKDQNMSSVGFGGEFGIGENVVGTIDFAQTLSAAGSTLAGSPSVAFQLTARF